MKAVVYYELLKDEKAITVDVYCQQCDWVNDRKTETVLFSRIIPFLFFDRFAEPEKAGSEKQIQEKNKILRMTGSFKTSRFSTYRLILLRPQEHFKK